MAKMAILGLLLLSACGRSECDDYATLVCQKLKLCVDQRLDENYCKAELHKTMDASRATEAQCREVRVKISTMSCAQFVAFLQQ